MDFIIQTIRAKEFYMSFVIFDATAISNDPYVTFLNEQFPKRSIQVWPDVDDPENVDYALVWKPPAELFEKLPNLKAVFNLGAGVDALLKSNVVPDHLPIIRLIDPILNQGMVEYVTWAVLRYHRQLHHYDNAQKRAEWLKLSPTDARTTRVGILGLGELGQACAQALCPFGFKVMGWSRSEKQVGGVDSFYGTDGLNVMLGQCDMVVCLLPLTDETQGILNTTLFSKLPKGAKLIHVARGGHMVMDDVTQALDEGRLEHATLDVFPEEPLRTDHDFWAHPQITITPHIASQTLPSAAIEIIADNARRLEKGDKPVGLVNRDKGY